MMNGERGNVTCVLAWHSLFSILNSPLLSVLRALCNLSGKAFCFTGYSLLIADYCFETEN